MCHGDDSRYMGARMDFSGNWADPARRRMLLLAKALEHKSLPEALRLAQAAEAFVTGGGEVPQLSAPHTHQLSGSLH
jgi:hypothetical protein